MKGDLKAWRLAELESNRARFSSVVRSAPSDLRCTLHYTFLGMQGMAGAIQTRFDLEYNVLMCFKKYGLL